MNFRGALTAAASPADESKREMRRGARQATDSHVIDGVVGRTSEGPSAVGSSIYPV